MPHRKPKNKQGSPDIKKRGREFLKALSRGGKHIPRKSRSKDKKKEMDDEFEKHEGRDSDLSNG